MRCGKCSRPLAQALECSQATAALGTHRTAHRFHLRYGRKNTAVVRCSDLHVAGVCFYLQSGRWQCGRVEWWHRVIVRCGRTFRAAQRLAGLRIPHTSRRERLRPPAHNVVRAPQEVQATVLDQPPSWGVTRHRAGGVGGNHNFLQNGQKGRKSSSQYKSCLLGVIE